MQRKKATRKQATTGRKKKASTKKPQKSPAKKSGRPKKKTGHQGGPDKPPHMDPALRISWLEKYAARTGRTTFGNINKSLRMRQETLDHWLADQEFRDEMADIDRRRMAGALEIAVAYWPEAVRVQGDIAIMAGEDPPDISKLKTKDERLRAMEVYQAKELKKLTMTTRSAEFLADLLGARKKSVGLVDGDAVETFGRLPKEPELLVEEIERLEEVKRRFQERVAVAAVEALDDSSPEGD